MSAYTDAIHDFEADSRPAMTHTDCVERAKIQRVRFLARYKKAHCDVRPANDVAKILGCQPWQLKRLAVKGAVWEGRGKVRSPRNGRVYSVPTFDVDECRRALDARVTHATKACREFEKPPAGIVPLSSIQDEIAMNANTMARWICAGQLAGAKYVVIHPGGRSGWEWHVDRDEAIALFRAKRAGSHGNNMRRLRTVPVTALIRELWGMGGVEE